MGNPPLFQQKRTFYIFKIINKHRYYIGRCYLFIVRILVKRMRNGMWKKIVGSGVACSLVLLICAVLVPSATAVELSPGVP